MQLTADLSQLAPDVRSALVRKLAHEDKARYDLGVIEQRRLAQLYAKLPRGAFKDHIGPAQFVASHDQWHRAMIASDELKERVWQDPDFVPWLLKKNEDMRVRQTGTRIQVGYTGTRHA